MRVLQINTTIETGSTGRIVSTSDYLLKKLGKESFIAYGRKNKTNNNESIKIGNQFDFYKHILKTRLFDRHGFDSVKATKILIKKIKIINPDIIHLHNLHGYYLNVEILFNFLKLNHKPVVWTFHDCWPFTGHCTYYDRVNCLKWQTHCFDCPLTRYYPRSWMIDNSRKNFQDKKFIFTSVKKMVLVSPSNWLASELEKSFLKEYPIKVINNGINLEIFKPRNPESIDSRLNISGKHVILGVANNWDSRKGLSDFVKLRSILNHEIEIVLVGIKPELAKTLPSGIKFVQRTDNITELAELYSLADVYVNPTYVDNFPTTNIEALACGTPVITYNTGGSPEIPGKDCGIIVSKGKTDELAGAIKKVLLEGKTSYSEKCRNRALQLYDHNERFMDYIKLYETLQ